MEIISDEDFCKEITVGDALCAIVKSMKRYSSEHTILDMYTIDDVRHDFLHELGIKTLDEVKRYERLGRQ